MRFNPKHLLFIFVVFIAVQTSAQRTKRQVLEARRVQLQKDKVYINALLSNAKRKEKNLVGELNDIKDKIKISEDIISVISSETKELGNEIYTNQLEINKNKRDLEALKKDYANMVYKSYKSKSQSNRMMFLLSSENFLQAYKRFQYMKQYNAYRKTQGEEIQQKTVELQTLTDSLTVKKSLKQRLLTDKKEEQNSIEKEKKTQEVLLSQVKQKESKYKKQIAGFIKEEKRVNAAIERSIRAAIAASNKKAGKKSTSATFALTAEAKALASKFTSNRGKLPWPVEKGYVSTYYGKQPHPVVKTLTIQSNGVRITTNKGSKARAVFDGTVMAIQIMSGNKKAVLIQHGNYITVYKNLENVTVSKGSKVKTKQSIGTIFTDKITSKTILDFVLLKNTTTENPVNWIYKM
ncbi:Septal ring factor EnvC, activator of murein hydrolases AmiA and AmiB [Lutibacter oricola]|uniref:Septal ring factor EnvC, activator of murein hydrolases AmiA and AmiB n=1 Tax=Lutibacter oricola TaxID=762486 RepID=A0A1H3DCD0_9FLAO|nr:peptidoglycan DD-metalloendopeptidase family protein [Lutibacter oricola]SDX64007.1 Septal ring factor EnvC, activator of murein hydrolases AmiA and AmiB [Lutibacter oricola]